MPTERRYTGVEPHGTGWRGVYRVGGVRHRTNTYPTKREAFMARTDALASAHVGLHVDRRRAGMTCDQWFAYWHPTRRIRPITAEHDAGRWTNHVSPFLGGKRLDALTPHLVERWLRWMQDTGRSDATQRKAYVLLKTALGVRGAIGDRRLAVNPCDSVRPPRYRSERKSQMTREQFEAILGNISGEQHRAVALVGAYAGLRWSEMAALRRRDYNPLRETLTVSKGVVRVKGGLSEGPNKTNAVRTILVPDRLKAALDLLAAGKAPDDLLFTSKRGTPINHSSYRTWVWRPAVQAAGVPSFTFHDTRHAYASWLLESGMDLLQVMELMGHANVTTTQLYLHSNDEKKRAGVRRAFA